MRWFSAGLSAAAALLALALAGAAQAQVITSVPYTLDAADPGMVDHYHDACTLHAVPPRPGPYEARTLTVTVPGVYAITDQSAPLDGSMGIVIGPPPAFAPLTNCYASVNDSQSVFLNAGVYTLMLTRLDDGFGAYAFEFDGPAAVTVVAYTPPTGVPTLSEWAMALFGGLLLAGGGWMVRRRRLA